MDVSSLAGEQCGTSWERADREPAAATSTWRHESPAFTAEQRSPQRGIRDGLCLNYPPKCLQMIQRWLAFVHATEGLAFIWKMANDSPAKSLVDIDLASLRVSASPNRVNYFFLLLIFLSQCSWFYFNIARHVPRCCLALVSFSPFSGAEVKKMTAEQARCCHCLVFLCSRCIWHGAQQLAHIGQCYLLLCKILTLLFYLHWIVCFSFFFYSTGPSWNIRIGRSSWKWHLWTSIQGWLDA